MLPTHRILNRAIHAARRWIDQIGAIAPGTDYADEFGSLGMGSCIAFPPATLMGTQSIFIGDETLVGRSATLSVGYGPQAPDVPERGLVIGNRCVIGTRASITAHESITLGDDVWLGQDVFISDASHGYQDPERPIGLQMGQHQPVSIGSGTWIGHGAIILPGAQIGRNVVVAAGSVVRGEVEDHAVVAGVPAVVVRRFVPGLGWVKPDGTGDVRPTYASADVSRIFAS